MRLTSGTRGSWGPIGVDVGAAHVKLVQLARERRGWHVLAAEREARPVEGSGPPLTAAIRDLLKRGGFRGRQAVAALPSACLRITQDRQGADVAAADRLGWASTEATIRSVAPAAPGLGPLVVGAEQAAVDARARLLVDAGLEPLGLEPPGLAVLRAYARTQKRRGESTGSPLSVDVGAEHSSLALASAGRLAFLRVVSWGGRHLTERVAARLGVATAEAEALCERVALWIQSTESAAPGAARHLYEPETGQAVGLDRPTQVRIRDAVDQAVEDLALEIVRSLRYCTVALRDLAVGHIRLSGGLAHDPLLRRALVRQVGLPVTPARPLSQLPPYKRPGRPVTWSEREAQWTVALGLALRGTEAPTPALASPHAHEADDV